MYICILDLTFIMYELKQRSGYQLFKIFKKIQNEVLNCIKTYFKSFRFMQFKTSFWNFLKFRIIGNQVSHLVGK